MNVLERELAPSLFVSCFLFTSGGFMLGSLILSIFIVVNAAFLFLSYRFQNIKMMVTSRIINYVLTIALFAILLSDSHVFEDSNVL